MLGNWKHGNLQIFFYIYRTSPKDRIDIEGWGFESPSGRDAFCLKNFDTFTWTPIHVSKVNAVARAQLIFQMLTLLQKYIYHQSQY